MIIIVSPDQRPVQIEESGSHGMHGGGRMEGRLMASKRRKNNKVLLKFDRLKRGRILEVGAKCGDVNRP